MAQNVRTNPQVPYVAQPDVVYEEHTTILPARVRRISWGAIVGGVVLAIVIQIAFQLLGLSIGANTINPATEAVAVDPALRNGAVIWIAAGTLLALFAGGWVASYIAAIPDRLDGVIHGLIVWGVATLISATLLTSSTASLLNGVTSTLGNVMSAAAQGVATVAQNADNIGPEITRVVQDIAPELSDSLLVENAALQDIDNEVMPLMRPVNQPATNTGESTDTAQTTPNTVQPTTEQSAQSTQEISAAVQRIAALDTVNDADRQQVVDLIVARTNLTETEAQETLTRWESSVRDARVQLADAMEVAAQRLADAVSALAGILFVGLVIGAAAAGIGGYVGSPDPMDVPRPAA